jgi:hypothetical protein
VTQRPQQSSATWTPCPPLDAFRSVRTFLQGHCDGACLSPKLKADLCEKAHIIKPLIKEKIFLEDIRQCFPDIAVGEKSCHVSYECPPGTPEGNTCITNSCASPNAETAQERIMLLLKIIDLILESQGPTDEEPQARFAIVDFLLDWLLKETGYD